MAFKEISNIAIQGIAACVPEHREDNKALSIFHNIEESRKFIESTGVEYRHIVKDSGFCTSDLCYEAAKRLLDELCWSPDEIDCLIFVSQTPDYILPATSCIIQNRLNITTNCYSMDISLGCSGWVYGLSVIASLLDGSTMCKGLLLAGDTTSVTKSPKDKSTYPLFGDAGTATAVEFKVGLKPMMFNFGTDGGGFEAIIIPDGGFRNVVSPESFLEEIIEPGIIRNRLQSIMNGPAVFTFGISKAPRSVNALLDNYKLDKESIDYYFFHQANLFMNEKIRIKLGIEAKKVPYSHREFGNTSSASIPLTMVTQVGSKLANKKLLACAFGVGLSWASVVVDTESIVCPDLIKI